MSENREPVDWEKIYGLTFVDEPGCWDTYECGSYCCRTSHPDFNFRFIQSDMVWLPMTPSEYRFLTAVGRYQDYDKGNIVEYSVPFLDGRCAAVHLMRCKNQGMCLFADYRPLICRIYPYFPVPTVGGQIARLAPSSLLDNVWDVRSGAVGCPMRAGDDADEAALITRYAPAMSKLFDNPYLIFYFRLAWRMMELMRSRISERHPNLLSLEVRDFWREWEGLYMSGQLVTRADVEDIAATEYLAIEGVWGSFSTE